MKKLVLFHRKFNRNRKGGSSLEFLLNLLIYLPIFILLFQISLIPLQQFYLTQVARSGALVYIQIRHFNGHNNEVQDIFNEMVNENTKNITDGEESKDGEKSTYVEQVVEKFIQNQFKQSADENTLPGKIFNTSKIKVNITDTGIVQDNGNFFLGLANKVGKTIADLFSTEEVTITVSYPFTLFKVFNLSFGTFNIQGTYTVRYNP